MNALETTVDGMQQALREDFGDLRHQVDRGFAEMRGKLGATATGQEHIADLIQGLIDGQGR